MKKRLYASVILVSIFSLLNCAMGADQLQITVSGAGDEVSPNTYEVAVPGSGSITITAQGSGTVDAPTDQVCWKCDGPNKVTTNPSVPGDKTYFFSMPSGASQNGDTVTFTVSADTPGGNYAFQLTKISQNFSCPAGYSEGDPTNDNNQSSVTKTVKVLVPSNTSEVSKGDDGQGNAKIVYQVLDQNSQPLKKAGLPIDESTNGSTAEYFDLATGKKFGGGTADPLPIGPLGVSTDANGKFTDTPIGMLAIDLAQTRIDRGSDFKVIEVIDHHAYWINGKSIGAWKQTITRIVVEKPDHSISITVTVSEEKQ